MTDDITVVGEPKRSDEYLQLLDDLTEELKRSYRSYISAEGIAARLYEQGKKEGLSNGLIRKDIECVLDGIVKPRRLREILPLELKRKYTISQDDADADGSALSAESETSAESGTYIDNMAAFKKDVNASEAAWKAKILQMAQDLDMKGSVPKDRIAVNILYDLRDAIDKGTITTAVILDALPSEYKLPPKPEKKIYEYAPESEESKLTNVIINMVDVLSGMSCDNTEKMPPSQVVIECKNHMRRIVLPWSDDQLLITRNALRPLTPLVKRFQEMVDEEVQSRREKAKLLSR